MGGANAQDLQVTQHTCVTIRALYTRETIPTSIIFYAVGANNIRAHYKAAAAAAAQQRKSRSAHTTTGRDHSHHTTTTPK